MLGVYESFPQNIHGATLFKASISNKKLQSALIQTLQKINSESFYLEEITTPSIPQCIAILEFGIAETNCFNFLDKEETNKVLKFILKKPFQTMDFFCAIRYYKMQKEKKTPLKFDYYMIRFIFHKDLTELQIFHERGPRYMVPQDIVNLITVKINEKFPRKILKAITPF